MNISIVEANEENIIDCVDIIGTSEVGKKYYANRNALIKVVTDGIKEDDFVVAKSESEEVIGLLWYQSKGMFGAYPYLHMVAVKVTWQGKGIGSMLLDHFEKSIVSYENFKWKTKVFLTVGDFNENAERVYLNRGYQRIAEIDSLYKKGVVEKVLMKNVSINKREYGKEYMVRMKGVSI